MADQAKSPFQRSDTADANFIKNLVEADQRSESQSPARKSAAEDAAVIKGLVEEKQGTTTEPEAAAEVEDADSLSPASWDQRKPRATPPSPPISVAKDKDDADEKDADADKENMRPAAMSNRSPRLPEYQNKGAAIVFEHGADLSLSPGKTQTQWRSLGLGFLGAGDSGSASGGAGVGWFRNK
eukprot:g5696.t1